MTVTEIARSTDACLVKAETDNTISRIWFKSKPVDREFCYRAVQLQLLTDSTDQGYGRGDIMNPGSWSWFEIAILPDEDSDTPRIRDGKDLVWHSHGNRCDPQDTASLSRCYGKVFDRREGILDALEIGNVIAVRVCARYAGWVNHAREGRLHAKILNEGADLNTNTDIFSPMSWTLSYPETPDIPRTIENGIYTLISPTETYVQAHNSGLASVIWFTTPVLDHYVVNRIEDLQLFTVAHHQKHVGSDEDKWSWFDLVILASPEATKPRVKDGRSLVWKSHNVVAGLSGATEQQGRLFTLHDEIFKSLEPGNVIGVRVCAQFSKWETHAHNGRLVVRISNKGPLSPPTPSTRDWSVIHKENTKLQEKLKNSLEAKNGMKASTSSIETDLLGRELRADHSYGAEENPLKLLSIDGGGVRGISCLYILKDLMSRIAGDPNAKPCDYFDMMAGTSTGGLVAIMLGRLRMSVDQCIEAYEHLASQVFGASDVEKLEDFNDTGARYSADVLENAIKSIVKQYTGDEDALMRDTSENPCKTFVVAVRADDITNRIATHLRTYTNPNVEKSFADYKIWEAARATSAAPAYFPRIKLGEYEYVDGGVGFDNPVLLLMGEAHLYYGFARSFDRIVSLGTGIYPNVSLPEEGTNVFENIADTTEEMKSAFQLVADGERANHIAELLVEPGHYYRFNVGVRIAEKKWVEEVKPSLFEKWFGQQQPKEVDHFTPADWAQVAIDLDDYKGINTFIELTQEYLKGEIPRLTECAAKLPPKRSST